MFKSGFNYGWKALVAIILFAGCKKDPGLGGTSSIKGRIIVHDFDAAFQIQPIVYPAVNISSYIIYGTDNSTYDNSYKTSYDGSYEYKYLQKGKYKIFAYSIDSTGASRNNPSLAIIPKFIEVDITEDGITVNANDLIILNNKQ